jgi:NADH:ubiquinone oxidoreductase subunit F (NADH-binding)
VSPSGPVPAPAAPADSAAVNAPTRRTTSPAPKAGGTKSGNTKAGSTKAGSTKAGSTKAGGTTGSPARTTATGRTTAPASTTAGKAGPAADAPTRVAPKPDARPDAQSTDRSPRLLVGWAESGRPADLAEHLRVHGALPRERYAGRLGALRLVQLTKAAGLRGRGGAGFPTARKMQSVLDAAGPRRRPVVVANGCEGDLTSGKDGLLLHGAAHLVLDGLALAAHAVGADQAIVCLHRGSPELDVVEQAIAERTDDPCEVHLVTTPARYVSSEASALVNFLTTGDGRPTTTPPLPSERGVQGRPTLVDNVETLAHLALIARHDADWFRGRGTRDSPGTMLVTVDGAINRPGVYEVDLGTRMGQLIRMAGGASGEVRAAMLGGLGGSWLPLPSSGNLALDHAECRAAGVGLGVASLVLLPADACGLAVTSRIVDYLAGESAKQCGPCMFGLPSVAEDLAALAEGRTEAELRERLERRLGVIPRRGACSHPDGAVRLAASALSVFADDVAEHLAGRPCGRPGAEDALPMLSELPGSEGDWK